MFSYLQKIYKAEHIIQPKIAVGFQDKIYLIRVCTNLSLIFLNDIKFIG